MHNVLYTVVCLFKLSNSDMGSCADRRFGVESGAVRVDVELGHTREVVPHKQ